MIEQEQDLRRKLEATLRELMVGDEEAGIRLEAALGLASLGTRSPDVVEHLLAALSEGSDADRRAAVRALARTGDADAAHRLLDALEDSPELWQEIAAALPRVIDPATANSLIGMIRSASTPEARRGAIRALVEASAVAPASAPASIDVYPAYEDEVGLHPLF